MTTVAKNIFERLRAGRLAAEKTVSERDQKIQHAQRLLDWLQRWDKPTLSTRDIRQYGPGPIRDRKSAIDSAEILVRNGWLTPVAKHRFDMHKWEIIRRPIVNPEVAT
jgi:hypothetical protein